MSPASPIIWIFKMTKFYQNDAHDREDTFLAREDKKLYVAFENKSKNDYLELSSVYSQVAHDREERS